MMSPSRPLVLRAAALTAALAAIALGACGGGGGSRAAEVRDGRAELRGDSGPGGRPGGGARRARRKIPVIGRGRRYRPLPAGRLVELAKPLGPLRCTRAVRDTYGTHLEIFLAGRDVVIPAGIGVASPRTRRGAYVTGGRCRYPIHTLEPTGLIEIDEGRRFTLGELFDLWGQPLSRRRLLSLRAEPGESVTAFVNGRRRRGDPRSLPLSRHAAIVLQLGGYFPPTRYYAFPPGL